MSESFSTEGESNVKTKFLILISIAVVAVASACSFSTANMSSFKTFKDKDAKTETTTFKAGDTIFADAVISNSMDKVTVKFSLADDKGTAMTAGDVKVELPSSGTAKYSLPIPMGMKGGKFKLTADMINDKGEKKESKSIDITIEPGAAPPPPPPSSSMDDKDDAKDEDK